MSIRTSLGQTGLALLVLVVEDAVAVAVADGAVLEGWRDHGEDVVVVVVVVVVMTSSPLSSSFYLRGSNVAGKRVGV
jgi:hypothetical protein